MNTKTTLFSLAALALASTGIARADVFADIEAAVPGSTVKLSEDVYYIELHKCITLDLDGHTIDVLHLRNQTGTITVKNGHIGNEIDGESGAGTAYCGTTVLEDLKVDGEVWVDGHTCYIKSGTYHSVNNHHAGDRFGTVYISGNNTYVQGFNGGGWDYSGGEVILLGGTYPQNPLTDYSRVFVDPSRTVKTLSSAPTGAPNSSYIYQVYDNGTPGTMGVEGNESEPNDDYMCANYIAPNGKITGQLGGDDEDDWFKVVIPEEGSLKISISIGDGLSVYYKSLYVIDNEGKPQERSYTYWGDDLVVNNLAAGPYYIKVHQYAGLGSYTLSTKFTPCAYRNDVEVNDDPTQAQSIALNGTVTGRLGYSYWEDPDVDDWYKIEVPAEGKLTIKIQTQESLSVYYKTLYAIDSEGNPQERGFTYWNDDLVLNNLAAGTYYIRVHWYSDGSSYGGYSLSTAFAENAYANDAEPNDDASHAKLITLGSTVTGRLGYSYWEDTDEDDWYKVNIPAEGKLTINIEKEESLSIYYKSLYVLDADGEYKERSSTYWGDPLVVSDLAAGTYYIRVHWYSDGSSYGGYSLSTAFAENTYANDAEPNDDANQAQSIALNGTVTGRLGYSYWNDKDEDDWYKIDIPTEGKLTIDIQKEESLSIYYKSLYVLNADGEYKERNYTYWTDLLVVSDLAAGTYYIKVHHNSGGSYGGYSLSTAFAENAYANDAEPDNDYTTAQTISFGQNYTGRLGYSYWNDTDEDDWFKVSLTAAGSITVNISKEESLSIYYKSIHAIKDGELKELGYTYWTDELKISDLTAGTYYIKIHRNSGYGGYNLKLDTTAGIEEITADESAAVQFDMMGRQISNDANAQGIMIRNGKKVLTLPTR